MVPAGSCSFLQVPSGSWKPVLDTAKLCTETVDAISSTRERSAFVPTLDQSLELVRTTEPLAPKERVGTCRNLLEPPEPLLHRPVALSKMPAGFEFPALLVMAAGSFEPTFHLSESRRRVVCMPL